MEENEIKIDKMKEQSREIVAKSSGKLNAQMSFEKFILLIYTPQTSSIRIP